jgi:methionyl-tRNA synthetase
LYFTAERSPLVAEGRFYITTPIYYPSDVLHIGHAYTTVYCDALARWHRFKGEKVFFLTGSDEHGQKIERAAAVQGKDPKEYVDAIVATFQALWKRLGVSYDDFIRTTEPRHTQVVQAIFRQLYEQGDIYSSKYEGWYCTPCETFCVENRLVDGNCPDCGRPVEWVTEESYFFRMSAYGPRLLAHIEAHPEFIQPATRRNEMVSFIRQGLEDLCVSRTSFDWGIPVPFDPEHVIYVWIDALSNYLTAIGYPADEARFRAWWPADVHVVGKDILRFHSIIWPTLLMALGLPLPKQVYGHGWLLVDSGKMSKSKGNVVDPNALIDEFGTDAIRYFLLREVPFGQDAKYARRALAERINADLANDLGNALHRSLSMLERFCDGVVPQPGAPAPIDLRFQQLAAEVVDGVDRHLQKLEVNVALVELWRLVGGVNKYIDETEPWSLAKEASTRERLHTVMYHVCEALRIIALMLTSFLPASGKEIWRQLGLTALERQGYVDLAWGGILAGTRTAKGDPLFPRLDLSEVLAQEEQEEPQAGASAVQERKDDQVATAEPENEGIITIDEFAKVQLRLAVVESAERVVGADKLLKLQVSLGDEKRQIVAGIAQHYAPEALVGKRIVVVANLKPAKLRGELSEGMLLAAVDGEGKLGVVTVAEEISPGATVR